MIISTGVMMIGVMMTGMAIGEDAGMTINATMRSTGGAKTVGASLIAAVSALAWGAASLNRVSRSRATRWPSSAGPDGQHTTSGHGHGDATAARGLALCRTSHRPNAGTRCRTRSAAARPKRPRAGPSL